MAQAAAVAKPPRPPRRRRASATPRRLPYLLIAPAAPLMLGFIAYPVLSVFYYSLQEYNPTKPWRNGFAGFDNFTHIFTEDPLFWDTLVFSAKWVVVEVGLQLTFGLALALIVNQTFVGRALGRALVFSPWAVSGVLTSAIWVLLYNSQTGITRYLADMGIGDYGERRSRTGLPGTGERLQGVTGRPRGEGGGPSVKTRPRAGGFSPAAPLPSPPWRPGPPGRCR